LTSFLNLNRFIEGG
jgi:ribonuclease HI